MGVKDTVKKPLKRIYWWLHGIEEKRRLRQFFREKQKKLVFPLGKKAYIIGTPSHENLGDSAIVLAQKAFLRSCGLEARRILEITDEDYERYWPRLKTCIGKGSLIAQLGGGHMGNQWPQEEELHRQQVLQFPDNPSVIFPQTLYYLPTEEGQAAAEESRGVYNGKRNLTMVAREKYSFETMKALYPDTAVLLTPDIVLSADMDVFGARPQDREGILLCLRNDSERVLQEEDHGYIARLLEKQQMPVRYTDMYSRARVTPENRGQLVRTKMEELASARVVITDRLHGMVFCALTGTPCIVMSNNNHKVLGTYEWISYLPYIRYVSSVRQIGEHLEELLQMENCSFDNGPLRPYYEPLAKVVREYAQR